MQFLTWYLVLTGCLLFFAQAQNWYDACPGIKPIQDFQMSKFLGQWYAMRDTAMYNGKCVTYNYDYTPEKVPGKYVLNITQFTSSELFSLFPDIAVFNLTVSEPNTPGRMKTEYFIRFPPLDGFRIENVSHVVFMTDYVTYAGVFEYLPHNYGHRGAILSRTKTLDEEHMNMLDQKLGQCDFSPFTWLRIKHSDCPERNISIIKPYNDTADITI